MIQQLKQQTTGIPQKSIQELERDSSLLSLKGNETIQVKESLATISQLKKSIPKLTTEKAKAFEIFKSGYPSGAWIDNQKTILKQKYFSEKREQRRHVLTLLKRFVYYWPALLPFFSFRQRK